MPGRPCSCSPTSRPGRARLGGSVLAQVYCQTGDETPDVDDAARLRGLFAAMAELRRDGLVLAYHDRSDGGLFVTLCEMAFAGRLGLTIDADAVASDEATSEKLEPRLVAGLFAEELGAVLQVREADAARVVDDLRRATACRRAWSARPNDDDEMRVERDGLWLYRESRVALQRAWSETTWQMQSLRDNPVCARQEYDRIRDVARPRPARAPDVRPGRGRDRERVGRIRRPTRCDRRTAPTPISRGRRSRSCATRA